MRKQVYRHCLAVPETLNLVLDHVLASFSDPHNFIISKTLHIHPIRNLVVQTLTIHAPNVLGKDWVTLKYHNLALVSLKQYSTSTLLLLGVRDHA